MSRSVLNIYIKFVFDDREEHFVKWLVGWFNMRGITVRCVESRCSEFIGFDVVKMDIESDVDMFDFVLMLGMDLVRLMKSCPMKARIGICRGDECVDMNVRDLERWWEEEVWGGLNVDRKKGVKIFVHRTCDVCEELEATNVFLTWLAGFIRQNGYKFEVDNERSVDVWIYEVVNDVFWVPDVFSFVVEKGWYIAYAAYLIGAYAEVSICDWDEKECVNLYLNDLRKMERDELPVGL